MSEIIIVNGKKYLEDINVYYDIKYEQKNVFSYVKPVDEEDFRERDYIIGRVKSEIIPLLLKDNNSRQGCFPVIYKNGLSSCISSVHILLRNNTIILNEYYRSQNKTLNQPFDNQTAQIIIYEVLKYFPNYNIKINVFVGSYHKLAE